MYFLCVPRLAKLTILGLEMSLREPQFAQILPWDIGIRDSSHHKQIIGYCEINQYIIIPLHQSGAMFSCI